MSFTEWYESLEPHADYAKFYNRTLLIRAWVAGQKAEREACRQIAFDLTDKDMQAVDVLVAIEARE